MADVRIAQSQISLTGWTIYAHPSDFPDYFVVRPWRVLPNSMIQFHWTGCLCDRLDDARACVPPGLYNLGRDPSDDPVIVESWI